jgi:16S rRNA processing protein RimM
VSGQRADLLEIGRVVRPHGLKGQVVVELWTNREERMRAGSLLAWDGGTLLVGHATRIQGGVGQQRWLVSFEGVVGREAAESLRDAVLRAAPLDDPGALWVDELIGAEVFDATGASLGTVEAVEFNPASDLMIVGEGRLIPLRFVVSSAPGRVEVDIPPGLLDP